MSKDRFSANENLEGPTPEASGGPDTGPLNRSERETLKAIYRLTRDGSEAQTGAVADALGLAPGTVTALIKRFADRGLVNHRPYQGTSFTDEGRRMAIGAIRRHRIVERFLSDMLGYAWNEADKLAVTFEHDLPNEVVQRLYVALNRPATCPHGFAIPDPADDHLPATPELYELEPGDIARVAVSGSTDDDIVAFLDGLGVVPGAEVHVLEKHPFDGPLVVEVAGRTRTLGERVARQVYVTRTRRTPDPTLDGTSGADTLAATDTLPARDTRASDAPANREDDPPPEA